MATTTLSKQQRAELIRTLKQRFDKNSGRHPDLKWADVESRIVGNSRALWALSEMERTGGEPDVVGTDKKTGEILFYDCSAESPEGRRSICYDRKGQEKRKQEGVPVAGNVLDMAAGWGIDPLTEEQYRELQKLGSFDTKTQSWLKTPDDIAKQGGAIFGDRRFGRVFVYHNTAPSFYRGRGFRGALTV